MFKKLKAQINRSFFRPSLTGLLLNPFHIDRSSLYRGIQNFAPQCTGKIADIGCGSKPYEHLFNCTQYVGLDLPRQHAAANIQTDLFFDGQTLPLTNGSFDCAVAFQVFEHVFTPEQFLSEIHRVLKPDGHLLMTLPFTWDEHEQPNDFARYSSFGLKSVLENAGFQVVELHKTNNNFSVILQLVNTYLFKVFFTRQPIINVCLALLLTFPVTVVGIVLGWLLPNNDDLYLENIVLAQKVENDDCIAQASDIILKS